MAKRKELLSIALVTVVTLTEVSAAEALKEVVLECDGPPATSNKIASALDCSGLRWPLATDGTGSYESSGAIDEINGE